MGHYNKEEDDDNKFFGANNLNGPKYNLIYFGSARRFMIYGNWLFLFINIRCLRRFPQRLCLPGT